MKSIKPLEYVCLFQLESLTAEGNVFSFFAVDAFSQYLFSTGIEKQMTDDTIIKHIKLLTENQDFKPVAQKQKTFTIVLPDYENILPELNTFLSPLGGKAIVNKEYSTKITKPVIKDLTQVINKRK
jgi:hypothetical protein